MPGRRSMRSTRRGGPSPRRSEEHTSELQSQSNLVCRLLLEKKKKRDIQHALAALNHVYRPLRAFPVEDVRLSVVMLPIISQYGSIKVHSSKQTSVYLRVDQT